MKNYVFILSLIIVNSTSCIDLNSISSCEKLEKEEKIIDPIQINCFQIIPDEPIKSFNTSTSYEGQIVIKASVDTTNLVFNNYQIVFAKLKSKTNPNDTIEISMENKTGNFSFVENLKPELIKHLNYIKIKKTNDRGCVWSDYYNFPIKIE